MSKGSGKSHREGLTLTDLIRTFPDNNAAQAWFEKNIWGDTPKCPRCGNTNITKTKNQSMPYYCAGPGMCNKRFSIKVGTVMEHSKISYQHWAIATYQFMTNIKGISSMKLQRPWHSAEFGMVHGAKTPRSMADLGGSRWHEVTS